jgi:hypothetical protein
VPAARHLAVARAHDRSRYVCLAIDDAGSAVALAKVDVEEDAGGSLQHEADALGKLGGGVTAPLLAPTLIDSEPSLLLFEPILWRARLRPWHLPADVAAALGRFYAPAGDGPDRGATHGDFAPWNLLRTGKGWVLIDWEEASEDGPAFFDLWHYLVQSHVLLGRPNTAELARGMAGAGWVSEAVNAYTQAAGLERDDAVRSLVHYLSVSRDNLDPNVRHADKALRARLALLDRVKDL